MELLICILPFLLANSIVFAFQTKQSNYVKYGQHSISNQAPLLKTAPTLVSCATKCLKDTECMIFAFRSNNCLLKLPSCSTAYSEADALIMDCFVQISDDNHSPQNEMNLTIETSYCMENTLPSSRKCHVLVNKVGMSFAKATEICHGLAGKVSTSKDLSVTKGIDWLTTKLDDGQKAWIEASSETDCNILRKETGVVESTGANDCKDQHYFVICDIPAESYFKSEWIMAVNQVETKRFGTLEELDKIEFSDSDTEISISVSFSTPFNFTFTDLTIETTYCMENMLFSSGKCHVIVYKEGIPFTEATEICHALSGNVSTSMDLSVTKGIDWLTTKLDDGQKAWIEASSETDCNIFRKESGVVESTGADDCNDQHDFVICDFPFTDKVESRGLTSDGNCYLGFNLVRRHYQAVTLCNDLGFKLPVPIFKEAPPATTIPLDKKIFEILKDSATGNRLGSAWIGVRKDGQKYTKIDGTPFYINGTDVTIERPGNNGCLFILSSQDVFHIAKDCKYTCKTVCAYTCSESFRAEMKINGKVIADGLKQYDGINTLKLAGPLLTNNTDITKMEYVFRRTRPGRHGQIKLIGYKTED